MTSRKNVKRKRQDADVTHKQPMNAVESAAAAVEAAADDDETNKAMEASTSKDPQNLPSDAANSERPNGKPVHSNFPSSDAGNSSLDSVSAESSEASRRRSSSPVAIASHGGSSSHDVLAGSSTRRQALHVMADPEGKETRVDDRESRIKDLIAHRSLLLDRVRTCREAAEKRLGVSSLQSKNQGEEITDEEELAAFREMTKQANQVSKRPRNDGDGTTEKRTSLSLRKGSSVGKRMNAALSSLAPGSNAAAAASAVGNITGPASSGSSGINPLSTHAVPGNVQRNSIAMTTKSTQNSAVAAVSNLAASLLPFDNSNLNAPTKQLETTSQGRGTSSKIPRTASISLGIHAPPSSLTRPHGAVPTTSSQHMSGGATTINRLGSGRLPHPHVPRVYCAEAVTLREKRDKLREKLGTVLQRQQEALSQKNRQSQGVENDVRASLGSPSRNSHMQQNTFHRNKRPRQVTTLDINPPTALPQRRRTHWDTVLQEMSWLASDFIQERKWKVSTARLLSSELSEHHILKHHAGSSNNETDTKAMADLEGKEYPEETKKSQPLVIDNKEKMEVTNESVKTTIRYPKPSNNEIVSGKRCGRILSSMLSELNGAIEKGGAIEATNSFHDQGLRNFVRARKESLLDVGDGSKADDVVGKEPEKVDTKEADSKVKTALTPEEIGERIEKLHKLGTSRYKTALREFANALRSNERINLNSNQKDMVDFVEKIWRGSSNAGAVISGPVTSGKTYATATVMWKQQSLGPQLLLCPAKQVIRWKHELNKFANIRVVVFGAYGGISSASLENSVESLEPGDVVICEYANLNQIVNSPICKTTKLHSVVVDFRHRASLLALIADEAAEIRSKFPAELISDDWWDNLFLCLRDETRCLFIDYDIMDPLSLCNSDFGTNEQLLVLAKYAACIIGLALFRSSPESIHRQILAWARKIGKSDSVDKSTRIKKVLSSALAPMSLHTCESTVSDSDFEWNIRLCPMTACQRQDYEECCLEIRGAMSSCLENGEETGTNLAIIRSLSRLRYHCFHPKAKEILSNRVINEAVGDTESTLNKFTSSKRWKEGSNSSQPDALLAHALLERSSKLIELASILVEAGHSFSNDETIHRMVTSSIDRKQVHLGDSPKRVVIFAGLPEMRSLVSAFLNSIGIRNCTVPENADSHLPLSNCRDNHSFYNEVMWFQGQLALSRFASENPNSSSDVFFGANVLVASPCSFCFDEGLGLEGADVLVVLDSDWSGRDAWLFDALIRRWLVRKVHADKDVQLIRLVCEETIETRLFLENDRLKNNVIWPVDGNGYLTIPNAEKRAMEFIAKALVDKNLPFQFPALRLLRERGNLLSDVLSAKKLMPPIFGKGRPVQFLPLDAAVTDVIRKSHDLEFLRIFLRSEALSSSGRCYFSLMVSSKTSLAAKAAVSDFEPSKPARLAARQDLLSILPFFYLQKIASPHSLKLSEHGPSVSLSQPMDSTVVGFDSDGAANQGVKQKQSTLLLYDCTREDISRLELSSTHTDDYKYASVGEQKRGRNSYAEVFSSRLESIAVIDGNQGTEPLVFFPPLFPLLEESAKRAKWDYFYAPSAILGDFSEKSLAAAESGTANNLKRKPSEIFASKLHETKRPRLELESQSIPAIVTDTKATPTQALTLSGNALPAENGSPARKTPSTGTAEVVTVDADSESHIIIEDFGLLGIGALPRPVDAASFSAHDSVWNGRCQTSSDRYDFLSFPVASNAEDTNGFVLNDIGHGMSSMLLYVKKRPVANSEYHDSRPSLLISRSQDLLGGTSQFLPMTMNGDDFAKKAKKRAIQGPAHMQPTAFTRVQGGTVGISNRPIPQTTVALSRKEDHRRMILSSYQARLRTTGLSMFDSVAYRVSAIRAERRVMERLERLMWKSTLAFDSGPGLPIKLRSETDASTSNRSRWLSIAKRLQAGSVTGDAAKTLARSQQAAFRNSMAEPCRVDFGPFQVGFLASPSGMISMSTGRRRVGVSLPMGVKTIPVAIGPARAAKWTTLDDNLLQDSVYTFGENWLLIAFVMSGYEHVVYKGDGNFHSVARSSLECRDRWNELLQSQPSEGELAQFAFRRLRDEFTPSSGMLKEKASSNHGPLTTISSNHSGLIIINSSLLSEGVSVNTTPSNPKKYEAGKDEDETVVGKGFEGNLKEEGTTTNGFHRKAAGEDGKKEGVASIDVEMKGSPLTPASHQTSKFKQRSFAAVNIAKTRKHVVPITIPGVVSGQPPNQPVPSHPSHIQAVQTSVTAQWANGRTEMWPLQILDLADKQRIATRAAHRATGTSPSTARRQHHPPGAIVPHGGPPPRHHGHAPFPSVPPNTSKPVAQARVPPGPTVSSPPSHHQRSPLHHHRSSGQAYAPPQSTFATHPPQGPPPASEKPAPTELQAAASKPAETGGKS